jgi:DNA-binding transcriptional ArsR family regulator
MDTVDLILHPTRLRIVHALSDRRTLTTAQLCARMPDVSKATMYRHVGLLADAGILEVAGEQRVHGTIERCYRLHRARAVIEADAASAMSRADHRRGFAAAMAALLAEFNTYLDRDQADPFADSVSYRQFTLWLDADELAELISEVSSAITSRMNNRPAPGRMRYLLSTILFPTEDPHRP